MQNLDVINLVFELSLHKPLKEISSDTVTGAHGDDSPAMDSCNTDSPEPTTSDAEPVERRYPLRVNRGKPANKLNS